MEILSGLSNSSVGRLQKTWKKLEIEHPKAFQNYKQLCEYTEPSENYRILQQKITEVVNSGAACLPYLGKKKL